MKAHGSLASFLEPYDKSIQQLTWALRTYILQLVPQTNELIWDNYNAVAIAYSKSAELKDAFCHIAVYAKHVNFGFNRGAELSQSSLKLEGKGKLIRHLKIKSVADFQSTDLDKMIFEALNLSVARNEKLHRQPELPKSMVMSVSEKKKRPNPY